MARVVFVNEVLAGSVAGKTYSRNKGGYYVRQKVNPVQPQTQPQKDARSRFTTATSAWSALTTARKAMWENWAKDYFQPRNPRTGVTYSPNVAYTSLHSQVASMRRFVGKMMEPGGHPKWAYDEYSYPTEPVNKLFSPTIQNHEGVVLNLSIAHNIAPGVGRDGTWVVPLKLPEPQTIPPLFIEKNTQLKVGYALYVSEQLKSQYGRVKNPFNIMIGATPTLEVLSDWGAAPREYVLISCDGSQDFPTAAYKSLPAEGQWCEVTLVQVASNGVSAIVGSIRIVMSEGVVL